MQFEKPLDEDEETDEELPEDSNPIMDIAEKNLSSSNNGGRHKLDRLLSCKIPQGTPQE
jgi:hypothetical protein